MNIKNTKVKRKTLLLSLVVMLLLSAGATIAFIITSTDDVKNAFTPNSVSCTVMEKAFDEKKKENVQIKNTGTIPAYIRAEIVFSWQDEQGNILGVPVKAADYELDMGDSNKWILKDGFYYYTDQVAVNGMTEKLIDSCEPVAANVPDGYFLSVEIIASAIQADGESMTIDTAVKEENIGKSPVELAWGLDPSTLQ